MLWRNKYTHGKLENGWRPGVGYELITFRLKVDGLQLREPALIFKLNSCQEAPLYRSGLHPQWKPESIPFLSETWSSKGLLPLKSLFCFRFPKNSCTHDLHTTLTETSSPTEPAAAEAGYISIVVQHPQNCPEIEYVSHI